MNQKCKDYITLGKPRIVFMVLVTFAVGFVLAGGSLFRDWAQLLIGLLGTCLSAAGAGALNNYMERDIDRLMKRTMKRPLPAGRLSPFSALIFGGLLVIAGVGILLFVNLLTALLSFFSAFLYVAVYTPLKRRSWLNTPVGAIPGALPVLGGYTAFSGTVDQLGLALFALLFIWQHPHFYALAWLYKEDYARGGFAMLPVVDSNGSRTFRQILIFSIFMVPVSALPFLLGVSGTVYYYGALTLSSVLVGYSVLFSLSQQPAAARSLFRATLLYFPILLLLVAIDITSKFTFL